MPGKSIENNPSVPVSMFGENKMTASKFKVSDLIRVYDGETIHDAHIYEIRHDGMIRLGTRTCFYSPKQCRRLIKKPRRRVWIYASCFDELEDSKNFESIRDNPMVFTRISSGQKELIEFIEVKKRGG